MTHRSTYDVVVGNIGTVYSGPDESTARAAYDDYVTLSAQQYGRAAGEDVYLFKDGEPIRECIGTLAAVKDPTDD